MILADGIWVGLLLEKWGKPDLIDGALDDPIGLIQSTVIASASECILGTDMLYAYTSISKHQQTGFSWLRKSSNREVQIEQTLLPFATSWWIKI